MHQPNQTVPTGLATVPPSGPAMPVTETDARAFVLYTAPKAMAQAKALQSNYTNTRLHDRLIFQKTDNNWSTFRKNP
jgi:pyridoxine/pyridoxamine 5'-phosphate oxidase